MRFDVDGNVTRCARRLGSRYHQRRALEDRAPRRTISGQLDLHDDRHLRTTSASASASLAHRGRVSGRGAITGTLYVDHGLTGITRSRPGVREALAAVRAGDTLVVTKLDRLARSLPDARESPMNLRARASS